MESIGQDPFNHIPANPKNTMIASVATINQETFSILDDLRAKSHQPNIQKDDSQSQSR